MIALDTNVLVYCCDGRDPRRQEIALALVMQTVNGILLWQVANEFIAASRKLSEQGFTPEQAWHRLGEFLDLFPLVLPTRAVIERARGLHLEKRWSFWDAMLVSACLEAGVRRLYSEDLPGTQLDGLDIVDPFRVAG